MAEEHQTWIVDLGPAIESAIAAVASQLPADEIVGVGIATDADASSIVALANSRANLDQMIADEPEYALDSKWHLGEWDLDIATRTGLEDPLGGIRERLAEARASTPDVGTFRTAVWNAIADKLADSAARGFFNQWPHAVRVFLPLDANVTGSQIADWNAELNQAGDHAEFRKFLQLDD